MPNHNEVIRGVLNDNPDLETYEQVIAACAERGVTVGLWAVYFVAKAESRKLERRPEPPDPEQEIKDLALTLLGLHRSLDDAIATLRNVGQRNAKGNRIPWEVEQTAPTETWELSVAQELLDLCDGNVDTAMAALVQR